MKIKSIVSLCALAALPAFATDVESSNTFGTMKVTCNAAKVMVCTPWVSAVVAGDIKLTDLVMTDGLADGDAIILYANDGFKAWALDGGAWKGTPVTVVGGTTTAGDKETIKRGQGFWFVKKGYTSGTYDLYLYGQATSAAATSTITAGAYNLVANPNAAAFNILAAGKLTGAANGDSIQLGGGKMFKYVTNKGWTTTEATKVGGRTMVSTVPVTSISIPAGAGFWYVSKGSSNVTIAWQ